MKRIIGAVLVTILIGALAGCGATGVVSGSPSGSAGSGQKYTRTMDDKLTTGMSLPKAEAVMGGGGVKAAKDAGPGIAGNVYTWKNSDGSVVTASFMGGTLLNKNEAGL